MLSLNAFRFKGHCMTELTSTPRADVGVLANNSLKAATIVWFLVTLIGQWTFVYYMAGNYGGDALRGDFGNWATSSIKGYIAGDLVGNIYFGSHILLGAVLTFGGALQLIPAIRARAMPFHRWNGRLFIVTAIVMSLGALYLVWGRGAYLNIPGAIGVSLNGVLIIAFSFMTLRYALARKIALHHRWALRAFIVVNGVWFFRLGLMAWTILVPNRIGSTPALDGPFDIFISFGSYLVPLFFLELYFRTQDRAGPRGKTAMAVLLLGLTAFMVVGIYGAYTFMWAPRI